MRPGDRRWRLDVQAALVDHLGEVIVGQPRRYSLPSGERVPSVTTVLDRFKDAEPFIQWAYKLGLERRDLEAESAEAASVGTLTHQLIAASIRGENLPDLDGVSDYVARRAVLAFDAYLLWSEETGIVPDRSELMCISSKRRFGGTMDALATIDGARFLLDWKTGKKLHPEHLLQVAAYASLFEESFPDEPLSAALIIRLSPEGAGYWVTRVGREQLEAAGRCFMALLRAYAALEAAEKLLRRVKAPRIVVPATAVAWDEAEELLPEAITFGVEMGAADLAMTAGPDGRGSRSR